MKNQLETYFENNEKYEDIMSFVIQAFPVEQTLPYFYSTLSIELYLQALKNNCIDTIYKISKNKNLIYLDTGEPFVFKNFLEHYFNEKITMNALKKQKPHILEEFIQQIEKETKLKD